MGVYILSAAWYFRSVWCRNRQFLGDRSAGGLPLIYSWGNTTSLQRNHTEPVVIQATVSFKSPLYSISNTLIHPCQIMTRYAFLLPFHHLPMHKAPISLCETNGYGSVEVMVKVKICASGQGCACCTHTDAAVGLSVWYRHDWLDIVVDGQCAACRTLKCDFCVVIHRLWQSVCIWDENRLV